MLQTSTSKFPTIIRDNQDVLLESWIKEQLATVGRRETDASTRKICNEFMQLFLQACQSGDTLDISGESWTRVKALLSDLSKTRALEGYTPSETATFIFSLKQPLFSQLNKTLAKQPAELTDEIQAVSFLLDRLGLYTCEVYTKSREQLIEGQRRDLLELSTPVINLWKGVVALPIVGTLDSSRSQIMMERLLEVLATTGATVAILDISGVPAIDTLVAQHLLKTIQAARIMGAHCIISGIRPETAQTIVHLGIDLTHVKTKSTMARALEEALNILKMKIVDEHTGPAHASKYQ